VDSAKGVLLICGNKKYYRLPLSMGEAPHVFPSTKDWPIPWGRHHTFFQEVLKTAPTHREDTTRFSKKYFDGRSQNGPTGYATGGAKAEGPARLRFAPFESVVEDSASRYGGGCSRKTRCVVGGDPARILPRPPLRPGPRGSPCRRLSAEGWAAPPPPCAPSPPSPS
jgi:hypothetical protein